MSSNLVHLTINQRPIAARAGATILQACRENLIHVPTLCHYEGLPDVGACRLCIVEIDGQRRPTPACTTPAADGMVVRTSTPLLEELRRHTLELIFGERNHICPFCPRSGHCELQTQAYQHGMDHVRYDYLFPQLAVDNSHPFITLDHNRCILCSRCVRACHEWVGAHVLDFDHRGSASMLIADEGVPLGESSCVSCGTCVSVCPTGALFEKRCSHWHGRLAPEQSETICPGCGVGCRISASVRHRNISELASAGGPDGNRILCRFGRFGLVNPAGPRIEACQQREAKQLVPCELVDVVAQVARRLDSPLLRQEPARVAAFLSPRLPLETLTACKSFMSDVVGSPSWTLLDRGNAAASRSVLWDHAGPQPLATLDDLEQSDLFVLLGCNLERWQGVIASYVRRGVLTRGARLVEVDFNHGWFEHATDLFIKPPANRDALLLAAVLKILIAEGRAKLELPADLDAALRSLDDADLQIATGVPAEQIRRLAQLYAQAERPMILCGRGLTRGGPEGLRAAFDLVKATGRRNAAGRWRLMDMAAGANTAGARWLGPTAFDIETFQPQRVELAFVVIADDETPWPNEWLAKFQAVPYLVALLAREHAIAGLAHAVVPTATWSEREGTFVNLESRVQHARRLMPPVAGCVDEAEFLRAVATAWRGKDLPWRPARLPAPLAALGHDHLAPSGAVDARLDLGALRALVS